MSSNVPAFYLYLTTVGFEQKHSTVKFVGTISHATFVLYPTMENLSSEEACSSSDLLRVEGAIPLRLPEKKICVMLVNSLHSQINFFRLNFMKH